MRAARRYILLFAVLTIIYHSNLRPVASGDSLPAALIPFSLWLDGSIALNRFGPWMDRQVPYGRDVLIETRGNWYSRYPVAGPALAAPLYLPVALVPRVRRAPPGSLIAAARVTEKFAAAAIAALSALGMLALLLRIAPAGWAWGLTWLFALGTSAWSTSSQALWQHTFGQAAIVACLYFLERRWFLWCGVAIGIAIAVRPTNLLLVPSFAAALGIARAGVRDWTRLLAPAAAGAAVIGAYNWRVFGSLAGGYPSSLDGNFLEGLAGVLASPGRGLLVYTPLALFAVAAFLVSVRPDHRPLRMAAAVFALLQIGVIAKWPMWWGGYCWGPRLLTEIVPGLMVLIALGVPALRSRAARSALAAVAVYCVWIQALGVYYYPKGHWDHLPESVNQKPGRLWNWRDNPIARTAAAGPAMEPYVVVATAFREGLPAAMTRLREYGINPY